MLDFNRDDSILFADRNQLTRLNRSNKDETRSHGSTPRANPSPEVTDPFCRLPLPTFVPRTRGYTPWRPAADIGTVRACCITMSSWPRFSRFSRKHTRHPEKLGTLYQSYYPISGRPDSRVVNGYCTTMKKTSFLHGHALNKTNPKDHSVQILAPDCKTEKTTLPGAFGKVSRIHACMSPFCVISNMYPGPGISTWFPFEEGRLQLDESMNTNAHKFIHLPSIIIFRVTLPLRTDSLASDCH